MITRALLFLSFLFASGLGMCQSAEEIAYQEEYNRRILLSRIDGTYIPTDLEDAFTELKNLSEAAGVQKFKLMPEDLASSRLQGGIGRWMLINWGLYEGSRLSHHIKSLGIHHPEDMSLFLLVSFHRHLNDTPLKIEEQVQGFVAKRLQEQENRDSRDSVIQVIKQ